MVTRQTFNPPLSPRKRVRNRAGMDRFIEGEDFAARCPPWAARLPDGAFPTEPGWYIAVSTIGYDADSKPVAEPVWVERGIVAKGSDGWLVNEIGSDRPAERRDFYWIAKIDFSVFIAESVE